MVSSAVRCVPFVVAAACAVACSKPAPPTLTPERVTVTGVDAAGLALTLSLSAANPNSSDLTATDVSSHVVMQGHDVGTVTVPQSLTLPAGKTTKMDVPVKLAWSDATTVAQLAASNAPIPYTVDGTLNLGGSLLHVGVPFHLEGNVTHQQILSAIVRSMPMPR